MKTPRIRRLSLVAVAMAAVALSGCESAKKIVGNTKDAPDEFVVYSRPPLSLPPAYSLRPPSPGSSRPLAVTPGMEAEAALVGRQPTVKTPTEAGLGDSPGTFALLQQTGGLTADPTIRQVVDSETSVLSREDQRFVDKLIFWVDDKPFQGTVVDAEKEQRRIQENQALGKEIDDGETPQIKRKRGTKGLLEF